MNTREFDFLGSIDSLSEEQIIAYLFSSTLPYSLKKIICDYVNTLEFYDDRLKKIRELFIRVGNFDESLLRKDYCPNEIKKIIYLVYFFMSVSNSIPSLVAIKILPSFSVMKSTSEPHVLIKLTFVNPFSFK